MKSKNKKLILVGAGEFAAIAYEYFTYDSDYEVVAFAVNKEYIIDTSYMSLPVVPLEDINKTYPPEEHSTFIAVPSNNLNELREKLYLSMKSFGYAFATYISSKAFVWRNVEIGENCFIFENNTIQPFVKIKNNVILWSGNHIGHRTVINENVFVTSHVVISGYCEIGKNSFLGVNSTFNDGVSLPAYSVVGSASLVNKSPKEENKVYVGSPAKPVPRLVAKNMKL